jgi:hypothetical protein
MIFNQKSDTMNATFIKSVTTENTGGNIMNDTIVLNDGKVIIISDDIICYYNNIDDYNNGSEPIQFIEKF